MLKALLVIVFGWWKIRSESKKEGMTIVTTSSYIRFEDQSDFARYVSAPPPVVLTLKVANSMISLSVVLYAERL